MHSGQKIRALVMTFWALIGLILFTASSQSAWSCQFIDHNSETPSIVIYTTSWCPYCKKAKHYFDSIKVSYTDCDVERSSQALEQFERLGGVSVPLIVIGDEKFSGFNAQAIQNTLEAYRISHSL